MYKGWNFNITILYLKYYLNRVSSIFSVQYLKLLTINSVEIEIQLTKTVWNKFNKLERNKIYLLNNNLNKYLIYECTYVHTLKQKLNINISLLFLRKH
jgi:hypothetical protein